MAAKTFRAIFPSEYRSVPAARRSVATFAAECGFDAESVSDIALAVGEACNNATEHGHVAQGCYTVTCAFDGLKMYIEVQDLGCGFDPAGSGDPQSLVVSRGRGFGIFIMRSLMDFVEYSVTREGTRVVLVKKLPRPLGDGSDQSDSSAGLKRSVKRSGDRPATAARRVKRGSRKSDASSRIIYLRPTS